MMERPITDSPSAKAPGGERKSSEGPSSTRKSKSSTVSWSITGLLVVIIAAVIVFAGLRKAEEPVPQKKKLANVEVVTVRTKEYREALTLPALVEADRVAAIRPEFSGTLERWFFPEGAHIERGLVVAELDTEILMAKLEELEASLKSSSKNVALVHIGKERAELELENAREQAKAQGFMLKSAQSELALAKSEFQRVQNLVRKKVVARTRLDTAKKALIQAELSVARAKEGISSANLGIRSAKVRIKETRANLELADARLIELEATIAHLEVRIEKSKLKAPISGRIEEHLIEPGEVVAAGAPLAYVYDLRYLRATVNVPDRYVAFLDPENPAARSFTQMNMPGAEQRVSAKLIVPGLPKLAGGSESDVVFGAEIARIAQSADAESNTFRVELRLSNPSGALRHGVIARGKIEYLNYPNAIVIPVKAVQVTDVGPRVLIVEDTKGTQIARVRDIEPISIRGSEILIRSGLAQGDRLIVSGWKGLVGGEKVNVLVEDGRFMPQNADSG